MVLCAICESIPFRALLLACLQQCRDRQEAVSRSEEYDTSFQPDNPSNIKHHDDIFEVERSSGNCDLCKVIFQAFKKRNVVDVEMARGLPIVFRPFNNKIEVCYETEKELINLCGLDVYMNQDNGE